MLERRSHPTPGGGARRAQRIAACVASAVVTVFVATSAAPAEAERAAPNETISTYEIGFMKGMVAHHHMAVMMSEICVERTAGLRPELVELCEQIIETQHHEIMMMQSWLAEWFGMTGFDPHHEMGPEMMQMLEMMRTMTPEEFERFFLEDMIVHHAAALQPARQCKGKAFHGELKALCGYIAEMQVAEIDQMRAWLCEWFGECHYHVDPHRRKSMHG